MALFATCSVSVKCSGFSRSTAAANPALRSSITTNAAVDECLFAPTTVVRQAKTSGEVGGCPFRRGSLFILGLGSASKGAANRDLVFLSRSWSRCPAEQWVPALLEGVWTRVLDASEKPRGPTRPRNGRRLPVPPSATDAFSSTNVPQTCLSSSPSRPPGSCACPVDRIASAREHSNPPS